MSNPHPKPDPNPYNPPRALPAATDARPYQAQYDGFGGWLIVVGISLIITPLLLLFQLTGTIRGTFMNGVWGILTSPASSLYDPLWAPVIISEVAVKVVSLVAVAIMVPMYLARQKHFPKWFIWFQVLTLVATVVDASALSVVNEDFSLFDAPLMMKIAGALLGVCAGVPYMMFSKRVVSTFRR